MNLNYTLPVWIILVAIVILLCIVIFTRKTRRIISTSALGLIALACIALLVLNNTGHFWKSIDAKVAVEHEKPKPKPSLLVTTNAPTSPTNSVATDDLKKLSTSGIGYVKNMTTNVFFTNVNQEVVVPPISVISSNGNVSISLIINSPNAVNQAQSTVQTQQVSYTGPGILPPNATRKKILPPQDDVVPQNLPSSQTQKKSSNIDGEQIEVAIMKNVKLDHSDPLKAFTAAEFVDYEYGLRFERASRSHLNHDDTVGDLTEMLEDFADRMKGPLSDDDDFSNPANMRKQAKFKKLFTRFLNESSLIGQRKNWMKWLADNGRIRFIWFSQKGFDRGIIPGYLP